MDKRILKRAEALARKRSGLLSLVRRASRYLLKNPFAFGKLTYRIEGFFRLLKAWALREYRDVSWKTIVVVTGAILYFVSPLDAIPDITPALGFMDDLGVLAWAFEAVGDDVERFLKWERRRGWRY